MYKLEKNSPISNVVRNVKNFFPKTLWAGQAFLVSLTLGTVALIAVHHPALQTKFNGIVGVMDCLFASCTLGTMAWTVKNFEQEKTRWMQLGKKMEEQRTSKRKEATAARSQFMTPEQLTMRQFVKQDKIVPIDLFTNTADDATGGRQEEVGFSKVLKFPRG